jgi:hypothetical protein
MIFSVFCSIPMMSIAAFCYFLPCKFARDFTGDGVLTVVLKNFSVGSPRTFSLLRTNCIACFAAPTSISCTNGSYASPPAGQRYSVAKTNNQVTKGKDGIELIKDEEYIDPKSGVKGRFTKKIYHLGGLSRFAAVDCCLKS